MQTVLLALGSNTGDRAANLRAALEKLGEFVRIEQRSKVYESEPMYVTEQPRFFNMTVAGSTALAPQELLSVAKRIEAELGRGEDTHNLPRPIDIDILLYGQEIIESPELTIPHPRMLERAFVLLPLSEIAPALIHPIRGLTIADLRDGVNEQVPTIWEAEEQL